MQASAPPEPTEEEPTSPTARRIGLVLGPLLFALPLVVGVEGMPGPARATLGVTLLVATLWITQAIPIPAASLLPLVLFPLLGVAKSRDVVQSYADDLIFLFLGGFMLALAIERCGLHRRLALAAIAACGGSARGVSFGFMAVGAAISCWISNTATTLMLLPIALAVITAVLEAAPTGGGADAARDRRNFPALVLLCVAYGASLGGLGTPIGTPPNAVFLGQVAARYPDRPDLTISFLQWMMAMIPLVVVAVPTCWYLLERFILPCRGLDLTVARLHRERETARRPLGRDEVIVGAVFVATALLWVLRRDVALGSLRLPGWSDALGLSGHVSDATVALVAALSLFVLPSTRRGERLLDWSVQPRLPWGLLLLFGGGFAIAGQFEASGLSTWLGELARTNLPQTPALMISGTCVLVIALSEVASNTATATILLPVMASLSEGAGLHPFTLMLPTAVAATFGFMLPVATAPNAIVFGTGRVSVGQMARAGLLLDLVGVVLVTLAALVWWPLVFR